MAKERRSKIQLYYDIVSAIVEDSQNNDSVSPTRIQFKCNTSYDKLTKYLEEMKERQEKREAEAAAAAAAEAEAVTETEAETEASE